MLDQEKLYKYILAEKWKQMLAYLHNHKKEISSDPLLARASNVFETAFFSKVKDFAKDDEEIVECLETLYQLHHSKFYTLTEPNFRTLVLQLVISKPLNQAVNYARLFPNETICIEIIERATKEFAAKEAKNRPKEIAVNWTETYNRIFELINDQKDEATYFSGPKFINVVRKVENFHPDYNQYIEQRNFHGKSTSRKIFFYDILMGLDSASRISVVIRILDLLRPFKEPQVGKIEMILGLKTREIETLEEIQVQVIPVATSPKKVFISYSWDDEEHKQWVLNLANKLRSHGGLNVILDRYYLNAGKNVTHFIETKLREAQKILVIFTPNYKLKADNRKGGVGFEYSIVNNRLYNDQINNDKIIPILRKGSIGESIPEFMQQYIHLDLRNDDTHEISYTDLLREIHDQPAIEIPPIGKVPDFN